MSRPSWDEYFMQMCDLVATRSTCDRKHVGTIIVKNNRIIATGYNGSIPGLEHCDFIGHDIENNSCQRTVHSEVNAIAQAARLGISTENATLYCNTQPCWTCFKTIISAGITKVIYRDEYKSQQFNRVKETAQKISGFTLQRLRNSSR